MLALKQVMPRRLVRLREIHRLSQRALAEEIGVCVSTLTALESGQARDLMVCTLLKVCDRFQVSPDYLLGFEGAALARAPQRPVTGPCATCGTELLAGEVHSAVQCIYCLYCVGDSEEILAARFGISIRTIRALLHEEFDTRKRRPFTVAARTRTP